MFNETKRARLESLRMQLESERQPNMALWRDCGDYILPSRFRQFSSQRTDRRSLKIIDSTGTTTMRTLKSGMMSGVTSPARPWFKLSTPDPSLSEFPAVKEWLHQVTQVLQTIFVRSNTYRVLPTAYGDVGTFATAGIMMEEDFDKVIRLSDFQMGSFCIANNDRGQVDAFTREFRMTVRQVLQKFADHDEKTGRFKWENFSDYVKNEYDRGNYESFVDVVHVINSNLEYQPKALSSKFKRYASCYYEKGTVPGSQNGNYMSAHQERFLRESGYDYFPILAPRWESADGDAYGVNCPGYEMLGDVKQLQVGEKRSAQAIEKKITPPMIGHSALKNQKISILPGDITFDDNEAARGFRPAHEVNISIADLEGKQEQIRSRIRKIGFEDLVLMLQNDRRSNITATEIDERKEEKLLAFGPVLENLNQDLLDPMIDIAFAIAVMQGHIPEAPKELQGVPLKVEYISVMAQAQKLVGIATNERFLAYSSQIMQLDPETRHKVNFEQLIDIISDQLSLTPGIVRSDEEVEEMKAQIQEAQRAQAGIEMIERGASAAKNLSGASLEGDNALNRMISEAQAGQMVEGQG